MSELVWITEEAIAMTGSQDGNKFTFTAAEPFAGVESVCKPDYNYHITTSNNGFMAADCYDVIRGHKCVHVPDTNYFTLYPANSNGLVVGSCLNIGGAFDATYNVQSPLPNYNIWPFRINSDVDLNRELSQFFIGQYNTIFPVIYNPDSLPVSYLWEQLEGDPIPLNATSENQTYPVGALGANYLLQYGVKLRLTITIDGDSIVETRTIAIVSKPDCAFNGTRLICTEFAPLILADPSCASIVSSANLLWIGSNPLCVHDGEKYTVYFSIDCRYTRDWFYFAGGGIEQRIQKIVMPYITQIQLQPNRDFMDLSVESSINIKFHDYYYPDQYGHSSTISWTQLEGDPLPYFPNSSDTAVVYEVGSPLSLVTIGTFKIQVHIVVHNSNGWEQTVTKSFPTIVSATGYQFGYKIAYIANTQFRLPSTKDSCFDVVYVWCRDKLGTHPQCVSSNTNAYYLYADLNDHTLEVGDCLDLKFGGINSTFSLQTPFPEVSLSGIPSLVDSMDSLTLTAIPLYAQDLSPIFNWTQISGVDSLVFTQGEAVQTFLPFSVRAGVYEVEMQMTIPNMFNYNKTARHTWTIKSKLQEVYQMGNIFELFFTWGFYIDDLSVNDPLVCDKILDTANITLLKPIGCKHRENTLSIYVSSSSTLVPNDIFQLKALPDIFSETISYTVLTNLPRISFSGSGIHYLRDIINITGEALYIDGFVPNYTFIQDTGSPGPMTLILNSSNMSQSLPLEELLTMGEYVLQLEMDLGESSLGYKDSHSETLRIEGDIWRVEQYGGRFRIYLTYGAEINGGGESIPIACEDILDPSTATLLQPTRCEHKHELLTIYMG